ncbi:MAG TPA: VOC family protein [Acidimicrobiales bacterium]|nr:VOC family protein [Acidimicrobiales bacterium]
MQMSHTAVYVRNLETMLDFYGGLGFVVSDRATLDPDGNNIGIAFITAAPDAEHHQLDVCRTPPNDAPPRLRHRAGSRHVGDPCRRVPVRAASR